ncbi:transposase [Paenibacillus albidus]|uniref:transposase n=1 Tax=Paenibacillus albidus TaxID=2041023 RepID=UPI001BE850DB|nr:transposase [Paenibacillus albidus]MBT2292839.1 transposase [Paenibacillus albidus]
MSEIKRGRGYAYAIQYHIVWCVKYRHNLVQIASDNNFTISEIESNSDHIHLLVDCASVSEHTEAQIRTYIQNQKVK